METTLHRQLKEHYAGDAQQVEVRLGRFRIDAIVGGELIEIQHGSLAAIRDKIRLLCDEHCVRVVKPIVVSKSLVKRAKKNGKVVDRRQSPLRGGILQLFDELVYFTRVFPHQNLTLEVPLVEVEEWRYPGHGRRRRWRERDHVVEDQKLMAIRELHTFRTAHDLTALLPTTLPKVFDTAEMAGAMQVQRWIAQRIAYCLRKMNGLTSAGKRGNALLYQRSAAPRAKRKTA
jgi:hypothetical protein